MVNKQLNLTAPLMSARRYSSPLRRSGEDNSKDCASEERTPIPTQRSELSLGEVVKPGSVPFMWEHIPGKAKSGSESQATSPEDLPSTPKLPPFPPGRKSGELNGFRTPNKLSGELVVPKLRNKISGELNVLRPLNKFSGELNTLKPPRFSGELNTIRHPWFSGELRAPRFSGELNTLRAPRFSGELNTLKPPNKFSGELDSVNKLTSLNDAMVRWDSSKEDTEMDASSETENDGGTFSDALDAFSQLESSSVNCSISGLSESERPETKPTSTISTDPKARDFMMDRFLPAAKAMTLEPSQYSSRRQPVNTEQSKEAKALVPRASTPPPNRNLSYIVPYTGQNIESEESEEGEDNYDDQSAISVKIKACGFLPWFCSKNSLRLLNPLPSMKDRSKTSVSKVSRLLKTGSMKSPSPKLPKNVPCSNHNPKVNTGNKSCELQMPKYTSRPMFYSGELQTRSGSPYRSARRTPPPPYRSESPHSVYRKGVGFVAVPKRVDSYEDNRSKTPQKDSKRLEQQRRNTGLSGARSPVAEKTLYIDSVNITETSHSILNLPKPKKHVDDLRTELKAACKSGSVQEVAKSLASFHDGVRVEIMKARSMCRPVVCGDVEANASPLETFVSGSVEEVASTRPKSSQPSKMSENWNVNTCRQLVSVADDQNGMQQPLTPPLPKSPSESWLSRKLPSATPRNSVSYSSFNSKLLSRNQNANTPSAKWETIVKSSHLRHDHGRYSEELVTHVPQCPRARK